MEERSVKKRAAKKELHADAGPSPFDSFATPPVETPAARKTKPAAKKASSSVKGKKSGVAESKPKKPAAKKTAAKAAIVSSVESKPAAGTSPFAKVAEVLPPATSQPAKKPAKADLKASPVFKALSEPVLPKLERENRARLMMQTPTELYFYWSVRENPYQLLRKAFGDDTGSYTLALKLTNLNTGEEELHPAEAEGNWWFHVEPNGKYEAEIGFYAPNRPYFRVIYSNAIETPRRAPSPRPATEAVWTVSANKFAEVLDVAGFTHDAVDVVMAGDDHYAAETATHIAFSRFVGVDSEGLDNIAGEDIRYALRALASGTQLEELRYTVGAKLFAILQSRSADLSTEKAVGALADYFDVDESEYMEETEGPAVHGASLVSFPRTIKPRRPGDRFAPVSSHSYPKSVAGS